ncbi:helix-turn-helix domain-containing protein [Halocatena halophila]|uniref:helix-turn-helix domain-containing protein n=1 Tax=Halocatena halophila TaxID=2814576 RepID=UPI002ED0D676
MRYITVVFSLSEEYVRSQSEQGTTTDPREIWMDGTLIATQEAIQYQNLLEDGTAVAIVQFRGDADRFESIADEEPEIISCAVTGGDPWLAYLQFEPEALQMTLFELFDREAISIDWPMRETPDGLRVTLFGEDAALQRMMTSIPQEMEFRLERAGEYRPELADPIAQLTDRQKEIVRTAIAAGYYELPRRATQADIADELGLAQGTVGEHLRRAEAKIIQSVVV